MAPGQQARGARGHHRQGATHRLLPLVPQRRSLAVRRQVESVGSGKRVVHHSLLAFHLKDSGHDSWVRREVALCRTPWQSVIVLEHVADELLEVALVRSIGGLDRRYSQQGFELLLASLLHLQDVRGEFALPVINRLCQEGCPRPDSGEELFPPRPLGFHARQVLGVGQQEVALVEVGVRLGPRPR